MMQAVISKQFASGFALSVNLEVLQGVTVLYGPSGAGKTLTLDSIAGFVTPDSGRITLEGRLLFDGEAGVNVPPRDRACGYVFQNYALFPHMSVRANLAFAANGLPRLERHRIIADLLERFRLTELADRSPDGLSGGQKQRVSIARALIARPKLLLLDEPGRGLDSALRLEMYALLREVRQSLTTPMLMVTHDLEECFALADKVLIYEAGKIIHAGTPAELLTNPGSAAVARLLGGFNVYEAEVLKLDPGRQTSRIRMLGHELDGPNLRACFKGDRILLCARPEELRVVAKPGDNRIRVQVKSVRERPQSVRVDFGEGLVADLPREEWHARGESIWVEIPPGSLRQLSR